MVKLGRRRRKIFGAKKSGKGIRTVAVLTFVVGFAAVFVAGFKMGRQYSNADIESADNQTAHLVSSSAEAETAKP